MLSRLYTTQNKKVATWSPNRCALPPYLSVKEHHADERQRRSQSRGGVADDAVALVRQADAAVDL